MYMRVYIHIHGDMVAHMCVRLESGGGFGSGARACAPARRQARAQEVHLQALQWPGSAFGGGGGLVGFRV